MVSKIKVGFLTSESQFKSFSGCDIILSAFGVYPEVVFKTELSGKTEFLYDMGRTFAKQNSIVFLGAKTDNYGIIKNSVIAFEGAHLLGISDATRSLSSKNIAFGYKIYNTKKGRFGVLVGDDLCIHGAIKTLVDCECDAIIDLSVGFSAFDSQMLVQTLSYLNGVSICFLNGNKLYATSPRGELVYFGEGGGECILPLNKIYREWTIKSRGS